MVAWDGLAMVEPVKDAGSEAAGVADVVADVVAGVAEIAEIAGVAAAYNRGIEWLKWSWSAEGSKDRAGR